ncbi:type I-C CRISPR-associated protein Cas8c/Csd1 [Acidisoma cladoniae]|uniref:type I-C CRISPR-associated protein Cas8c/Csd1 n=1 Tax=Acidisoma cladoniae TaxID=3040935 RepID=UPI00254E427E|nr:type I-C CRISPR-associated protein Cas8c/Csd1 [Acidisoma sp. PAMC 29798]
MTILQSLATRYERMAKDGKAPIPGFAPAQISFAIVLDKAGNVVTVDDLRVGEGKKLRPKIVQAPTAPKRTVGIATGVFWDKTSYVLGRTKPDMTVSPVKQAKDVERLIKEHAAFVARHETLLSETNDIGCFALLAFLRGWSADAYDALPYAMEMLDQNVAFRLHYENEFVHDRPAARAALMAEADGQDSGPKGMCLVTGETLPIARLHPSIKGIAGAQSSGAALVSFNLDSFTSYGHAQGANAPVSEAAAFAYATTLNSLLANDGTTANGRTRYRNRVMLGETTVAFWAEHGKAEILARALMGEEEEAIADDDALPVDETTETSKLRDVLTLMQDGKPLQQAAPDMDAASRVYVLGLSPNAARLSVRFWVEQTLGDFARHFQQHWEDLRMDPPPHPWPPPLWRLLLELAPQRKAENVPPHLSGEVMRAVLTGLPYPRALLTQTIMRIRSDRDEEDRRTGRVLEKVSDLRVATLKACLARMYRWKLIAEDVPVSLDLTTTNSAYRLGRLFSVLEQLQRAALGQRNATVRDRFYASASATPALVFPSLIRNARNHSKTIRTKVGAGLAEWFEDRIAEIASGLEGAFPKTLPMEEQGRFALGYYHQRDVFRRKKDVPAEIETAAATADLSEEGS